MIEFKSFVQIQSFYQNLRKQRENQKFLRSIEIIATFVLISIFLFFAILPTLSTISSLVGEIKSKEALIQKMRSKINTVIMAQDNFAKIQDKYPIIESSLPDRPKYFSTVSQMQLFSQESSVNLEKITFNVSDDEQNTLKTPLQKYSVNLSLKSYFSDIMNFIVKSLNSRRLTESISFKFAPAIDIIKTSTPSADRNVNFNYSTDLFFWRNLNEKK